MRTTLDILHLDLLTLKRWDALQLKRVYTKPKGKMPDYEEPVVLRAGRHTGKSARPLVSPRWIRNTYGMDTVEDFCNAIHRSLVENFKTAIVYGKSVKHQPQKGTSNCAIPSSEGTPPE